jgi:hypothetical protein
LPGQLLRDVADYYASQPLGMAATYRILETVDFTFTDRATLTVYLCVLIQPAPDGAKISHYQVSRLR